MQVGPLTCRIVGCLGPKIIPLLLLVRVRLLMDGDDHHNDEDKEDDGTNKQTPAESTRAHLAHDVPHVGVVHGITGHRPRVAVENVHEISLLAVLEHEV